MKKKAVFLVTLTVIWMPLQAFAHHGGITLTMGPGSPIETDSPFTLPEDGFVLSTRGEHVAWRKFDFAEPENKDAFTFYTLGLSYGIKPYLTGSLFAPYNIKRQDELGSTRGIGDIKFLLNLGFNHSPNKGLSLNTPEDTAVSLEESKKTYLSPFGGFTLPTGESLKELGGEIDRGMQPGFRSPTITLGLSAARHVAGTFSLFASISYDIFTEKDDFKFGNEFRFNLAGTYELYGNPEKVISKIDGILEFNLLNIGRDEEGGERLKATGGTILYLSPGMRLSAGNANLGIMLKFPAWKALNEKTEQQGAEGLEKRRVIIALSFFF